MTIATPTIPEQGQLVQVRSRPWVVNEVKSSNLPSPAMELPVAKTQVSAQHNHSSRSRSPDEFVFTRILQVNREVEHGAGA